MNITKSTKPNVVKTKKLESIIKPTHPKTFTLLNTSFSLAEWKAFVVYQVQSIVTESEHSSFLIEDSHFLLPQSQIVWDFCIETLLHQFKNINRKMKTLNFPHEMFGTYGVWHKTIARRYKQFRGEGVISMYMHAWWLGIFKKMQSLLLSVICANFFDMWCRTCWSIFAKGT